MRTVLMMMRKKNFPISTTITPQAQKNHYHLVNPRAWIKRVAKFKKKGKRQVINGRTVSLSLIYILYRNELQ